MPEHTLEACVVHVQLLRQGLDGHGRSRGEEQRLEKRSKPVALTSLLKTSQQYTMRVKIFVRQSHNSLILRYLKIEIPVAWNAEI